MMVDISFRHRGMDFFFLSMILVFFSFCSIQANIFFNSHSFLELLLYVAVFKYLRITSPHGNHLALFPGVWVCAHIQSVSPTYFSAFVPFNSRRPSFYQLFFFLFQSNGGGVYRQAGHFFLVFYAHSLNHIQFVSVQKDNIHTVHTQTCCYPKVLVITQYPPFPSKQFLC